MADQDRQKYESLRKILTAPPDPSEAEAYLGEALHAALAVVGVTAGSLTILNENGEVIVEVFDGEQGLLGALRTLEERMIASMRTQFGLETFYSTLNHEGLKSIFSYVVRSGDKVLATVSGICAGSRNIALEQEFIEVMAAAIRNSLGQAGQIKLARLDAMRETTATLNHEINNPLTVVLGNVQLLLMRQEELPAEVVKRLQLIEQSSLRIRDAVGKLMKLNEARVTTYIDNTKMIDLQDSSDSEE